MTINHIDQLREWWESAEEGVIEKGDTVINRSDGETTVYVAAERGRRLHLNSRILARAPKPKPAWHDAVAVMARCSNAPDGHREPFIRSEAIHDVWAGEAGHARTEDLRDVTPLIEAKVTDEMLSRAQRRAIELHRDLVYASSKWAVEQIVTAAIGSETE